MVDIDFLTIVVATIVATSIGGIWYSLFWRRIFSPEQRINKPFFYCGLFFTNMIIAYFLTVVETSLGANSFWDGIVTGFIIWLGFVATVQFINFFFASKPIKSYLLQNVYFLFSFMIMGGILTG